MLVFDWQRDSSGYELRELDHVILEPSDSELDYRPAGLQIIRLGGKLEAYRPLEIDGLYRMLCECPKTPEGALGFVEKFGMPEHPEVQCYSPHRLYPFIDGLTIAVGRYDEGDWRGLVRVINSAWNHTGLGEGATGVQLSFATGMERPEFGLRPRDLIAAIYLQLALDISGGIKLRKCGRCPTWFKYGPGTEHRSTARFCSRTCSNAHSYKRQKNGKAEA